MKKFKLVLSVLLLVCCFGFNSVNVSAHEDVDVSVFKPDEVNILAEESDHANILRVRMCICEMGYIKEIPYYYGPWGKIIEIKCNHGLNGSDLQYTRQILCHNVCTACSREYADTVKYETRLECHGYK